MTEPEIVDKTRITTCISILLGMLLLVVPGSYGQGTDGEAPNVLFIAVDDLRPQLGSFGEPQMVTPNIDRLAAEGVRFPRHYVQAPTCGASRYAMLLSRRLRSSRPASYGNGAFSLLAERDSTRPVALPRHFRRHGYHTVGIGKISHSPDGRRHEKTTRPGATDDPEAPLQMPNSWDEMYGPRGPWKTAWRAFFAYDGGTSRDRGKTPATESADVPDTGYPDGLMAEMAVDELRALKDRDQPFFLGVGFYKPHLPFNAPQRYWDLYDRDRMGLAPHPAPPNGAPDVSLHEGGELFGGYGGVVWDDSITNAEARKLRHGYYAATSYVDAQIGTVLDALERLGLEENTVVVLWGDHGWHLGNLGIWGKHTTYEFSLRSPLIVRAPGVTPPEGGVAREIVESVDIYPTLADVSGLPLPETVDGESLLSHLTHPTRRDGREGTAFGYWRRGKRWGTTVRTERYRLTRWASEEGGQVEFELYDHWFDPHETENVAEERPGVVQRLLERMRENGG